MSSDSPTVTVVIPTYNSSCTLRLALETVLWQDIADFEVWVVGDACTDDSEAVVESFDDDRVHWLNLPVNSGTPAVPRNEALNRARGRLIAYLGHDDLWFPWHLSQLVGCMDESYSDFAYSLGVGLGPQGVIAAFTLPNHAWQMSGVSPSNWIHRKDLVQLVGPWSPHIRLGDDRDFLQRVLAADVRTSYRRELTVLKFPSAAWQMYALSSDFPQTEYVEAMRHDALALRLELLLELGTLASRHRLTHEQYAVRLPWLLRGLIERAFDLYGRHRWPLNHLLYWIWRRRSGLRAERRARPGEGH